MSVVPMSSFDMGISGMRMFVILLVSLSMLMIILLNQFVSANIAKPLKRLNDSVNFDDEESVNWFHKTLRRMGIIARLREAGAKEGDTIVFADMEFDFVE